MSSLVKADQSLQTYKYAYKNSTKKRLMWKNAVTNSGRNYFNYIFEYVFAF